MPKGAAFRALRWRARRVARSCATPCAMSQSNYPRGRSKITAAGATGSTGDRVTVTLDSPDLAELSPLLPAPMRSLAGALHLKADFAGLPPRAGFDIEAKGERLKLPGGAAVGTAELRAHVAPGATGDFERDLASRKIEAQVTAAQIATPSGDAGTLRAGVTGTLAEHAATLALKGADLRRQCVGPWRVRHDAHVQRHRRIGMERDTGYARKPRRMVAPPRGAGNTWTSRARTFESARRSSPWPKAIFA